MLKGVSASENSQIVPKSSYKKESKSETNELAQNNKTNDTTKRISILIDFANRIPELYLKATLEEKRLILKTITERITYNEATNTLTVRLNPVFENLRQIKLEKKQAFSASLETLSGTLKTRSVQARQALENNDIKLSKNNPSGTRRTSINTKIEPNFDGSKKVNVDGGT